jgi:hypothetical protein
MPTDVQSYPRKNRKSATSSGHGTACSRKGVKQDVTFASKLHRSPSLPLEILKFLIAVITLWNVDKQGSSLINREVAVPLVSPQLHRPPTTTQPSSFSVVVVPQITWPRHTTSTGLFTGMDTAGGRALPSQD